MLEYLQNWKSKRSEEGFNKFQQRMRYSAVQGRSFKSDVIRNHQNINEISLISCIKIQIMNFAFPDSSKENLDDRDIFKSGSSLSSESDLHDVFIKKDQVKTSSKSIPEIDGFWKPNAWLESQDTPNLRVPRLEHATSFEQKSMEAHGKRLSDTYLKFIQTLSDSAVEKRELETLKEQQSHSRMSLNSIINNVKMQEKTKSQLIGFIEKSLEAEELIKQIVLRIPSNVVSGALEIAALLLQQHQTFQLSSMDEEELLEYIEINFEYSLRMLSFKLGEYRPIATKQMEDFTLTWMYSIFLGMNGIFEDSRLRRPSDNEWEQNFSNGLRKILRME